ncbi:alpha-acetolactate decarboxylase [Klebsiella pneumoniae]|nr:alpha-acetolactate decarboxylase [Klebsiella pneumoniae]
MLLFLHNAQIVFLFVHYFMHFRAKNNAALHHLLDYQLDHGVLTFGEIHKLMIDLPADSAFLQANLHPDNLDAAIRSVES